MQRDFRWFLCVGLSVGVFLKVWLLLTIVKEAIFFLGLIHVHLVVMLSCDSSVLGEASWVHGY